VPSPLEPVPGVAQPKTNVRKTLDTSDWPHHLGEAAKQWLKELCHDNKLIKNAFTVNGRQVNLRNITMPILNAFAKDDHIHAQGWAHSTISKVVGRRCHHCMN
jgi:poly(3-hydroxyalkanoate) synthetase